MRNVSSEHSEADGPAPAALDATSGLVYRLDADDRLDEWSSELARETGYTDEQLDGRHVEKLLAEADHERARAARLAVRAGGEWRGELRLRTSDGDRRSYQHLITADSGAGERLAVVARERGPLARADAYGELVETVADTVDALVAADTRADIERTLCERLVGSGLYRCVWVGHARDGRLTSTTTVGADAGAIEQLTAVWDDLDAPRPAYETATDGETRVVCDIPNAELPPAIDEWAAEYGISSGAAIPVAPGDPSHTVLVVYADRADAFDETELAALEQLGRVAGVVLGAARRERLVLSEPSVELEFRQTGADVPLVALAADADAEARLQRVSREDGDTVEWFTIEGADPERVVAAWEAADNVRSCRLADPDERLYEVVFDRSAVGTLLDAGAEMQDAWTDGDTVRFTATVPAGTDVRGVVSRIRSIYPETRLVAKRTIDGAGDAGSTDPTELSDRQLDVLAAAADAGYFEWPRDATAEEVADGLGVSAATLHYHLRRAERHLVEGVLQR